MVPLDEMDFTAVLTGGSKPCAQLPSDPLTVFAGMAAIGCTGAEAIRGTAAPFVDSDARGEGAGPFMDSDARGDGAGDLGLIIWAYPAEIEKALMPVASSGIVLLYIAEIL